jgi:hypothetical protein
MGGHCRKHLVIENLPAWSGEPNPVPTPSGTSESALWLAGHDGVAFEEPTGDPFTAALVEACRLSESFSGMDPVFDLRFTAPDAPSSNATVPWGQTADWVVGEGAMAGTYRARNLFARDFCCHVSKQHAYWVARAE